MSKETNQENRISNAEDKMSESALSEIISSFGHELDSEKIGLLNSYMDGILELNEKINLTAIRDRESFVVKHYVDSLTLTSEKEYNSAESIIDVGTGGGFPGVPLAIYSPEKSFTLLDSLDKRLKNIDSICEELGIRNVRTLHQRAEDAGQNKELRETFDVCVSRAVADLAVLSEYCLPFVKVGGFFVSYKGRNNQEEIKRAEKGIKILGGEIDSIRDTVTEQTLVIIRKTKATPSKYPRRAGDPKRKPL